MAVVAQFTFFIQFKTESYPSTRVEETCSNESCKNHGKYSGHVKYCPNCGAKVKKLEVACTRYTALDDLESFDEQFYPVDLSHEGVEVWLYNYKDMDTELKMQERYGYSFGMSDFTKVFDQLPSKMEEIRQKHKDFFEELDASGIEYTLDFGFVKYWD